MDIDYKVNATISVEQFIDILQRFTLGERRLYMTATAWEAWWGMLT